MKNEKLESEKLALWRHVVLLMTPVSKGGSRISKRGKKFQKKDVNLFFGQIFLKLHENEENWTEVGASKILLCRSATGKNYQPT